MCIVFCHRFRILYENHEDCDEDICPVANHPCEPCHTCMHQQNGMTCSITNKPLPNDRSGCCHWGITFIEGPLRATPAMVAPLPMVGFYEQVQNVLPASVPREQTGDGKWLIGSAHVETLDHLGIEYCQAHNDVDGVIVDPHPFILAINAPVSDILDDFRIPYRHEAGAELSGSLIMVEPGDFVLPEIFGKADFCLS